MVESTSSAPDDDLAIERISPAEKKLRARRLKDITFGQYKAIRAEAIELGVSPEVASMLPWYAANPQALVSALRAASSHQEIVARNVLGVVIEFDVLTAAILRSLENLRAEHDRYQGKFTIARYTTTDEGAALCADLTGHPSIQAAFTAVETQLRVVDDHISDRSPYGHDIKINGIRRGGVLFPVVLDLPDGIRIGGLESTDSYSRTLFAQHHSGITVSDVLGSWLEFPPTTPKEFSNHPIKKARNKLVTIAQAIVADTEPVDEEHVSAVLRAVMPKTSVVLAVDSSAGVSLDEVRRRLVSERHLDKQVEFSNDTKNETRAEAVIGEFDRSAMLPERDGFTQPDVLKLLENPRAVIGRSSVHHDDLVVAAAAVFLPIPNTRQDRMIFPAIRSRGVITPDDQKKKFLRSELATQVIMRSVPEDVPSRGLRQSALERALRQPKLRGAVLDARPVPELLKAALAELTEFNRARQRGESPPWGAAMVQITLRGACYLFLGKELALGRSPVGGTKETDNREATQIIEALGTLEPGLELLAQAIYDGRNNVALRLLPSGAKAENITTEPAEGNKLTNEGLRKWLGTAAEEDKKKRLGEDSSARFQVAAAALTVKGLTEQLADVVQNMGQFADKVTPDNAEQESNEDGEASKSVGPPYVEVHGLSDTYELAGTLAGVAEKLKEWNMRFKLRGGDLGNPA